MVDTKTFIKTFIAALVVMLGLAVLFYGLVLGRALDRLIDSALLKPSLGFSCITLGYIALAVLMAWVYPHYRLDPGPFWQRGLQFGVVMALLWIFPLTLVLHGFYRFPFSLVLLVTMWALVEQGAGGIVIAWVHQRTRQQSNQALDTFLTQEP